MDDPFDVGRESGFSDEFDENCPPGDRVQCFVEGDRMAMSISAGSNALVRWLGVFLVTWFSFMAAFTVHDVLFGSEEGIGGTIVLAAAWVGWFCTVGYWILARFGKTAVLMAPECLILRFELFGVWWRREHRLTGFSKAKLVVAHTRNEEPVYAVSIATADEHPRFGAFLTQPEKEWLVRRINRYLGCDDGSVFGVYFDPRPAGVALSMGGFEFGE
ncbi:MAG TPA: hypothetical protein VMY42_24935 [Thermoguttaceae bacterium]|nr:hypothetical protein [Thermoguttaceae bacterium]